MSSIAVECMYIYKYIYVYVPYKIQIVFLCQVVLCDSITSSCIHEMYLWTDS